MNNTLQAELTGQGLVLVNLVRGLDKIEAAVAPPADPRIYPPGTFVCACGEDHDYDVRRQTYPVWRKGGAQFVEDCAASHCEKRCCHRCAATCRICGGHRRGGRRRFRQLVVRAEGPRPMPMGGDGHRRGGHRRGGRRRFRQLVVRCGGAAASVDERRRASARRSSTVSAACGPCGGAAASADGRRRAQMRRADAAESQNIVIRY